MIQLDYRATFLRPQRNRLTPRQKKIDDKIPPIEEVRAMFRFDEAWNRLLHLLPTGEWEYVDDALLHVKIGKERYPIWRIKSLLVLGTSDGIIAHKSKLLNKMYPELFPARRRKPPLPSLLVTKKPLPRISIWEAIRQSIKMEKLVSTDAMTNFRVARKVMGFIHTSAYIPHNKVTAHSIFVDKLKAERMLEICELPANDPARVALSNRNFAEMPDIAMVNRMSNLVAENREFNGMIKDIRKYMDTFAKAKGALSLIDPGDEDEYVKMVTVALAHSHAINAIWRDLQHQVDQM